MIETKDTTALIERLEREFADEHRLIGEMERDFGEVKRAVPTEIEVHRPGMVRRVLAGTLAGLVIAGAGVGVGMAIQNQETQTARNQTSQVELQNAQMQAVNVLNAPTHQARVAEAAAVHGMKLLHAQG
jgi:hypothetical protein